MGGDNALEGDSRGLIQDREPRFKIWNIIIKFMICMSMIESIQMIKLFLNDVVTFGRLKKNRISRKNKLLVYLIRKMTCLGGILIPQEDALLTLFIRLASFFLRNHGIKGGTKNSILPY